MTEHDVRLVQQLWIDDQAFEFGRTYMVDPGLIMSVISPTALGQSWGSHAKHTWTGDRDRVMGMADDIHKMGQTEPVEIVVTETGLLRVWDGIIRVRACAVLWRDVLVTFRRA